MALTADTTTDLINEFFSNRYDYLLLCAFNSLKLIRKSVLAKELLTEALLWLHSSKEKLSIKIQSGQLEPITVNWMHKQVIWSDTSFKRKWVNPERYNKEIDLGYSLDEDYALSAPDETLDEEQYLENQKEEQDRLDGVYQTLYSLPIDQRILFDLIFNQNVNSGRKLRKWYENNLPLKPPSIQSCCKQIKLIKQVFQQTNKKRP